jgi:vacuolar-type H+-ATPase subunit I/STV1
MYDEVMACFGKKQVKRNRKRMRGRHMQGKNKRLYLGIALLVVIVLGFWSYRLLGPIALAEGYMYEDNSRMVYAKATAENDQVSVEVTLTKLLVEDTIPRLQTETSVWTGTMENNTLTLQEKTTSQKLQAKLRRDGLLFQGPLAQGEPAEILLAASNKQVYDDKLAVWTKNVEQEAAQKKKEVEEQRAKEAARVEFAKKVERTERLTADMLESAQYLQEIQFAEELQFSKDQVVELQGLLDELTAYAKQPGLSKTDYDVMAGTLNNMKVLVDGINAMDGTIEQKKKRMQDIIAVLETDMKDAQAVWEEIKASVTDIEKREKALTEAVKAGSEAIAQANERINALGNEQAGVKASADKLYRQAAAVLEQTRAKYGF